MLEFVEFNETVEHLLEEDNIVTVQNAEMDELNLAHLNDNFQELEKACPAWQQDTQATHPKWLEHHQSEHLTKDPGCPVCMEEAGSKASHRRRKEIDLAAFEASADGHKCCLVAAVTIEIDKESKLLPSFVPIPKKDATCAVAALKEALTLCQDRNLHQITGSRVVRIQADGGGEFSCLSLQPINHLRMVLLGAWLAFSKVLSVECSSKRI